MNVDKIRAILCLTVTVLVALNLALMLQKSDIERYAEVRPVQADAFGGILVADRRVFCKDIDFGDKKINIDLMDIKEMQGTLNDEQYVDRLKSVKCDVVWNEDDKKLMILSFPLGIRTCAIVLAEASEHEIVRYIMLSDCVNSYTINTASNKLMITVFYRFLMNDCIISENKNYILDIGSLNGLKYEETDVYKYSGSRYGAYSK